ncbi:MAG: hypothetical protein GF328_14010 [Candidatus Latescibacteria bacterium]|nr:hypothetical protein [Candidatus Latescibacterota bacterium]
MTARIRGLATWVIPPLMALGAMATTGIWQCGQAQVGDRPDIYDFSPDERADLYSVMTDYITSAVVMKHLNPPDDKHRTARFTVWHREYLKEMEDYLISRNRPQFVPLPRWDASTCIPTEFLVSGGIDGDCPTNVAPGIPCSPLDDPNCPNLSLIPSLSDLLCAQTPYEPGFRELLESDFHDAGHWLTGGVMGNYKSPAAPIFWLWHAFIDDIWFDWQCLCGNDEDGAFNPYTAAEKITDLQAGIADAWMQDSPEDIAHEPNNETGSVLWTSEDIWVRNSPADPVGSTRYQHEHEHQNPEYSPTWFDQPYIYAKVRNRGCEEISGDLHVYYANASTGLMWPGDFLEVSTSPVTLTNIGAGREHVAEFHWIDMPEPTPEAGDHFCLVARFVASPTSDDPINGEAANVIISENVKNSNQIAWKNLTIVDDVANNGIIVRNVSGGGAQLDLRFFVPEGQLDDAFFEHGTIGVRLGDDLYQSWLQNGAQGVGIAYNLCGQVFVLSDGASIDGLPIDFNEEHLINLQFLPDDEPTAAPCEDDRSVFTVNAVAYEGETLLGGNTYEIHPSRIRRSPEVRIEAFDPQVNCTGGSVLLGVVSTPPNGSTIQWLLDGEEIPGAVGTEYVATESGSYSVLISYENGCDRLSELLTVYTDTEPMNDSPCSAMYLEPGESTVYDIYCATRDQAEVSPGAGSDTLGGCRSTDGWCETDTEAQNSVWYRFVAPSTGRVTIRTDFSNHEDGHEHGVNAQLAVYEVGDCADYSTYSLVAANDNGRGLGVWGTSPMLDLPGLVPGAEYYMQIDGHLGAGGKGRVFLEGEVSDVPEEETQRPRPKRMEISAAAPNPSEGRFALRLGLPRKAEVDLRLIDVSGRSVAQRSLGTLDAGYHDLAWDTAKMGRRISRGVYYLEVRAGTDQEITTIVLK